MCVCGSVTTQVLKEIIRQVGCPKSQASFVNQEFRIGQLFSGIAFCELRPPPRLKSIRSYQGVEESHSFLSFECKYRSKQTEKRDKVFFILIVKVEVFCCIFEWEKANEKP